MVHLSHLSLMLIICFIFAAKLRLRYIKHVSYIRKRKGIGVRNIPAKKIKNDSLSNKRSLPPSTTKNTPKMPNMRKTPRKIPKSSIKTQLFGQETDDLVCDCNHDTDQYSDALSKLEPKWTLF